MKASELQIGDWVYDAILKCNTQVEMLSLSGIRGDCHDNIWNEKTFEPIPLTAEILEKNGFIGKEEGHYYSYHIRYGRLCNEIFNVHYQNHWIACSTPDNRDEFALFGIIVLRYVHELQHALRLCGIDKQITI